MNDGGADRCASELSEYIKADSKSLGLELRWYLPAVVKGERRRQMVERAVRLLEPIRKMERLLGHNLALSEEIVGDRVDAAIARQIEEHGLFESALKTDSVSWGETIELAVKRHPPFSPEVSDKGFKDAIILETYIQLVESLPVSPQSCRVILLCGDKLLKEAASRRIAEHKSATALSSLADLRSALNAVAARISQEEITKLVDSASILFFSENQAEELFIKWNMHDAMINHDGVKRAVTPGYSVTKQEVFIEGTTFGGKEGQTVNFETEMEVRITSRRQIYRSSSQYSEQSLSALAQYQQASATLAANSLLYPVNASNALAQQAALINMRELAPQVAETRTRIGNAQFSCKWQATLTQAGTITRAQLKNLDFNGVDWAEETIAERG